MTSPSFRAAPPEADQADPPDALPSRAPCAQRPAHVVPPWTQGVPGRAAPSREVLRRVHAALRRL